MTSMAWIWRGVGVIAFAGALIGFTASEAAALIESTVTIRGDGTFPNQTVGGIGVASVQVDDSGSVSDPGGRWVRFQSADVASAANTGGQSLDLLATVDVTSGTASTGNIEGEADLRDTFTIGAGSSGLMDGAPVQIRLQARFTGQMQLEGSPGGRGRVSYWVDVGSPGKEVEWTTGSLYPPAVVPIDESADLLIDTTVGATIPLHAFLDSQMQGTAVGPPSGTNTAIATAIVRISHAPGYETIEITSEAGAPIGPLPSVPLFGPGVLGVFAAALLGAGLWSLRRTERAA